MRQSARSFTRQCLPLHNSIDWTDNGELAGLSADAAFVQRAYETAVRQFFGQKIAMPIDGRRSRPRRGSEPS